jgi:hypothetical protein
MEEKSDIKNGNKLNTVLTTVVLNEVCKLEGVLPFKVINVYLLYEVFVFIVTAVAVKDAAD